MTEWIDVGVLLHAHGVRGEARLRLDPETPVAVGSSCTLQARRRSTPPQATQIVALRRCGDAWLAHLAGFASRDSLLPWHGARILWPRAALPPVADGEFYLWELQGAAAHGADGTLLGVVQHLTDNGAQPMLAIQAPDDPPTRQRLVPAISHFIKHFDRPAHRLTLQLPEGLWEAA